MKSASFFITAGTENGINKYLLRCFAHSQAVSLSTWRIHSSLLDIAISAWRPYMSYLSEQVDIQVRLYKKNSASTYGKKSDLAITAELDTDGLEPATLETRQFLKQLEDMIAEVALNLKHTLKTVKLLQGQFRWTRRHCAPSDLYHVDRGDTTEVYTDVFTRFEDTLLHYLEQSKALKIRVKSTSHLVGRVPAIHPFTNFNRFLMC